MKVQHLIQHHIPTDIFTLKENVGFVEQAQNLIDQCHPGATGMRLLEINEKEAVAEVHYAQKNRALHGYMHGGCFFTVGDTMTALMAFFYAESEEDRTLTMDASIRYLRPILKETVTARARLSKKDDQILYFVCDFFNEQNKRAAQAQIQICISQT